MKYDYGDILQSDVGDYTGAVIKIFEDAKSIPYYKHLPVKQWLSFFEHKGFDLPNLTEVWYQIQDFKGIDHLCCESKLILKEKLEIYKLH